MLIYHVIEKCLVTQGFENYKKRSMASPWLAKQMPTHLLHIRAENNLFKKLF